MDTLNQKTLDLVEVAIHEAAHYIVADSYGLRATCSITPNPVGGEEDIHYLGEVTYYGEPSPLQEAILCAAGEVAAAIFLAQPEDVVSHILESLANRREIWSYEDLAGLPEDPDILREAIVEAAALVETRREDVMTFARELAAPYANELMTPFN